MMAPTFLKVGLLLLSQLHLAWAMILPRHPLVSCTGGNPAEAGDTCTSFASKWHLDEKLFVSLNPDINCSNLVAGYYYCVIGSFEHAPTTAPTLIPRAPATSSLASNQPQKTSVIANCRTFQLAQKGETCDSFDEFGLDRDEFKTLNKQINEECTNLIIGEPYCVRLVGSESSFIATSSSSSSIATSAKATLATATTMATVTKKTGTSSVTSPVATPSPFQSGMVKNCNNFFLVKEKDTCYSIAKAKGIEIGDILKWNLGMEGDCNKLWLNNHICTGAPA